jgi:hypothetical protein
VTAFQDAGFAFQGTGQFAFQTSLGTGQVGPTPAGRAGKKRKRRYTIEIDGNEFEVDSYEQAVALLEQAREAAQPLAQQTARRAEKRIRRRGKQVAISLETPTISTPDLALQELVANYREKLRRIYEQAAQSSELRELLRRKFAEEDESDAEVLLILH